MNKLKLLFTTILIFSISFTKAQKIDSIYVNLYTDSLKKGTFNYINIDGLQPNKKYLPLDSTQLIFSSSLGKFNGNNLWIDKDIVVEKITIKVVLRQNPTIFKTFDIYIKKSPDPELKTVEQIMNSSKNKSKEKKVKK